jgi:hypothetical protein
MHETMQSRKKEEEEGWTGGLAGQEQEPQGGQDKSQRVLYSSTCYKSKKRLLEYKGKTPKSTHQRTHHAHTFTSVAKV